VSAPLVARVVPRASLDEVRRREMLGLMHLCYEGVSASRFGADLDAKQFVILLFARASGDLVGFSTLRLTPERLEGRAVDVVYSGDTVIHPDHWGSKTLQAAFGRFLFARKLHRPWRPCLWLLLSGGYKTYLMMVNHFPRSFPSRRYDATPERRRFLHDLATRWFGDQYDAARGVVRFSADHYRVRSNVVQVDPETARVPDVAFFLARNPGHAVGDELACLCEIGLRDLGRELVRIALQQAGMRAKPQRARAEVHT